MVSCMKGILNLTMDKYYVIMTLLKTLIGIKHLKYDKNQIHKQKQFGR